MNHHFLNREVDLKYRFCLSVNFSFREPNESQRASGIRPNLVRRSNVRPSQSFKERKRKLFEFWNFLVHVFMVSCCTMFAIINRKTQKLQTQIKRNQTQSNNGILWTQRRKIIKAMKINWKLSFLILDFLIVETKNEKNLKKNSFTNEWISFFYWKILLSQVLSSNQICKIFVRSIHRTFWQSCV